MRERHRTRLNGGAYDSIGERREGLGGEGDSLSELLPESGILLEAAADRWGGEARDAHHASTTEAATDTATQAASARRDADPRIVCLHLRGGHGTHRRRRRRRGRACRAR